MTTEFDAIRDELAKEHNKALQYFNNISFDQVYKNGFDTAVKLCSDERDKLEEKCTQLKIAVDKASDIIKERDKLLAENKRFCEAIEREIKWRAVIYCTADGKDNLKEAIGDKVGE